MGNVSCVIVVLFTHLSPEVVGSSEVVWGGQSANETAIVKVWTMTRQQ